MYYTLMSMYILPYSYTQNFAYLVSILYFTCNWIPIEYLCIIWAKFFHSFYDYKGILHKV